MSISIRLDRLFRPPSLAAEMIGVSAAVLVNTSEQVLRQ